MHFSDASLGGAAGADDEDSFLGPFFGEAESSPSDSESSESSEPSEPSSPSESSSSPEPAASPRSASPRSARHFFPLHPRTRIIPDVTAGSGLFTLFP